MGLKQLYPPPAPYPVNATNHEGAPAYLNDPRWRLVKPMTTGMVSDTFYADAQQVNDAIFALAHEVEPRFLAQAIVYAREQGHMRAHPIQLLVLLSQRDPALFRLAFRRVIRTGGDMLDFATVVLSGQIRQEFGSAPRDEVRRWLNTCDPYQFLKYGSKRQRPSLRDVIRLAHPRPVDETRAQLFRWVLGTKDRATGKPAWALEQLPEVVRLFEEFKAASQPYQEDYHVRARTLSEGRLPHEVVTTYHLTKDEWALLAMRMPYMALLRHLNTFARRGLFGNPATVEAVAARLSDERAVQQSKLFPYRFLSAYRAVGKGLPAPIHEALGRALEISLRHVPVVPGPVVVAPDISSSMVWPLSTDSKTRSIDLAALVAAAVLRRNPHAQVVPFNTQNHTCLLDLNASVLTNASRLAALGGGGTDVSLPFQYVLASDGLAEQLSMLIAITDDESWFWSRKLRGPRQTAVTELWLRIHARNPRARCVLINVAPYETDQTPEGLPGMTLVSGFSDEVFRLLNLVATGGVEGQLAAIEAIDLEA